MDDDLIPKVAELLGESPLVVMANVYASRANTAFARDGFKVLAELAKGAGRGPTMTPGPATRRGQKQMVAEDGIEPPTRGFSIPCSTD